MRERRRNPRRGVNVRGLISFDDGRTVEACRLVNLSAGGALVKVRSPEKLPSEVSLYFDDPEGKLSVVSAWCLLVRHGAAEAALRFIYMESTPGLAIAA
jgi:hypothetical protein